MHRRSLWGIEPAGCLTVRLKDVDGDGRPGVEVFVHEVHITTSETMAIFSFDGKRLRRSGELFYGGSDAGIRFGFTCHRGSHPMIVQDEFDQTSPSVWDDTATTFNWVGARLRRGAMRTTTFTGAKPPRSKAGVHC